MSKRGAEKAPFLFARIQALPWYVRALCTNMFPVSFLPFLFCNSVGICGLLTQFIAHLHE